MREGRINTGSAGVVLSLSGTEAVIPAEPRTEGGPTDFSPPALDSVTGPWWVRTCSVVWVLDGVEWDARSLQVY